MHGKKQGQGESEGQGQGERGREREREAELAELCSTWSIVPGCSVASRLHDFAEKSMRRDAMASESAAEVREQNSAPGCARLRP